MTDGYLSRDRVRINQGQRKRRERNPRIDYYPSPDALMLINAKRGKFYPLNINSGVLDAIVTEWADLTGIKWRKVETPLTSVKRPHVVSHYARASESGGTAGLSRQVHGHARENESGINGHIAQARAREQASIDAILAKRAAAQSRVLAEAEAFRAKRDAELKAKERVNCGARTRSGNPCRCKSVPGKRRCKWHGGCSTGPRTAEGKEKALANLKQFRKGTLGSGS